VSFGEISSEKSQKRKMLYEIPYHRIHTEMADTALGRYRDRGGASKPR
jgi:hypothetical protein